MVAKFECRVGRLGALRSAGGMVGLLCLVTALPAAPALGHVAVASHPAGGSVVPLREQTLYTSGTSAAPPTNFNPLSTASYTGTEGLLYEPLFLWDPVHGKLLPWLATSGSWTGPTTYRLSVRNGVDWASSPSGAASGPLGAADVAYSINVAASSPADPYHADVASVTAATAAGNSVTVSFKSPPGYAQWQEYLWHAPVLPKSIWGHLPAGERATEPNTRPVSSGPMLLVSRSSSEACYKDNPHWWGTAQLGLSFKFSYLCDVVSGSSGTALSQLLDDRVDWSNQLLRGIPNLADSKASGYGIKTYYSSQPYMLPGTTVWLQMDTARAPMDSAWFRRAVASAVDPSAIASAVYTGTVQPADPTGLLPELSSFISTSVVKKYGFSYSLSDAKRYLAKSGYKGQTLSLLVPKGWVDFVSAASLLTQQMKKAHIRVNVEQVPFLSMKAAIASGDYDMALSIGQGLASSPWPYFNRIYHLPLPTGQGGAANTERFVSPADWALVQNAASTPMTDLAGLRRTYSKIEADFLRQLPVVPLWYGGAWFQANTQRWSNYPSATTRRNDYTPVMWPGWLGCTTTVYALAALRLEKKASSGS